MQSFIKSVLLYVILIIILSYPLSYFLKNHFHTYNKQSWILNKVDTKFDYAVLGSSRVFNMVDINSLDSSYGKKGINLGTSGSCYAENYIILSEFISNNKISTLILNTDEFCFNSQNSYSYPFHDYEFLPLFEKNDSIFIDFMPKWKYFFWKIIPLAKYCEYNKQFVLKYVPQLELDEKKGTSLLLTKGIVEMKMKRGQTEITDIDKKYFLKILKLCQNRSINLIFITTPIFTDTNYFEKNKPFQNYIDSISEIENIPYYSYKNLINSSNSKYFNNNTHTNASGSVEYSSNLGKKLRTINIVDK